MSDIFKAIADPKSRLILEKLADKPASTVAKLAEASSLKSEQVATAVASLQEAGLLKATGSGASKKYSLNAKGFTPYVSWLAKVAETSAVANLQLQLVDLGDKIGKVVATGSDWVSNKVAQNVDVDPKKWAKELGNILAEIKVEAQKQAKDVQKESKKLVREVKTRVKP
jgi:DNA-binding transcriptional ArsR family regulator